LWIEGGEKTMKRSALLAIVGEEKLL